MQLDDGPAEPVSEDYLEDTTRYRQAPGEGEFDLAASSRPSMPSACGRPSRSK